MSDVMSDDEYYKWRADQDRFLAKQIELTDVEVVKDLVQQFRKAGTGTITLEGDVIGHVANCLMFIQIRCQLEQIAANRRERKEAESQKEK